MSLVQGSPTMRWDSQGQGLEADGWLVQRRARLFDWSEAGSALVAVLLGHLSRRRRQRCTPGLPGSRPCSRPPHAMLCRDKTLHIDFLRTPAEVLADPEGRAAQLKLEVTRLEPKEGEPLNGTRRD